MNLLNGAVEKKGKPTYCAGHRKAESGTFSISPEAFIPFNAKGNLKKQFKLLLVFFIFTAPTLLPAQTLNVSSNYIQIYADNSGGPPGGDGSYGMFGIGTSPTYLTLPTASLTYDWDASPGDTAHITAWVNKIHRIIFHIPVQVPILPIKPTRIYSEPSAILRHEYAVVNFIESVLVEIIAIWRFVAIGIAGI